MSLPMTSAQLLAKARSQLGTTEQPAHSNRQPYGAAYGINGVPWCAMFVWWCFRNTAGGIDLRAELTRELAWTPAFAKAAREHAGWTVVAPTDARAGDIAFFDFPPLDRIEHVGLVTGNDRAGHLSTIEGNTGISSDANGGAVMERSRAYVLARVIVRPPYADPATATAAPAPFVLRRELRLRRLVKMRGTDVRAAQRVAGATVDGVFGPQTARKVAVWQDRHHLAADGIVGRATARAFGWRFSS